MSQIQYIEGGVELIDLIGRSLWQEFVEDQSARWECHAETIAKHLRDLFFEGYLDPSQSEQVFVAVARMTGTWRPLGFCVARIDTAHHATLDAMFVTREFQNFGIGRDLLDRCTSWMDESGAVNKVSAVMPANATIQNFYAKRGFATTRPAHTLTPCS